MGAWPPHSCPPPASSGPASSGAGWKVEARSGQDWVFVRGSTQQVWSEDVLCLIVRRSCVVVKLKVWVLAFQPHSTTDQLHGFGLFPNLSVPQCPICAGGANNGQGSSQDNQGTDAEIGHEKCLQPLGRSALWLKTSHCPCCGWVLVGDSGPPEAGCLHQGL